MSHPTKDKDYSKECLVCQVGTISINPQAWRGLVAWHDMGHPEAKIKGNDLVATYQRPTLEQLESANPTPKEKSISEILDTAFNSDHTNGSHADDPSDKRPCYCHNRQYAEQALTAREASIRIQARIAELWNPALRIPENEKVIRERIEQLNNELKQIERG